MIRKLCLLNYRRSAFALSICLLTLCGCTNTQDVTTASGVRCQTTVHNYIVSVATSSQCWDKNGTPISDTPANNQSSD